MSHLFHLSFSILSVRQAKEFYHDKLGFKLGRNSEVAIIFDFFGHQLIGHVTKKVGKQKGIYPRHFGIVFDDFIQYQQFKKKVLKAQVPFSITPKIRFQGELTEHHTFFLQDPFLNYIEFKYYVHQQAIFGKTSHVVGEV